jgi:hypothetical protein
MSATATGYGVRGCTEEGCGAVLVYPDEGSTCAEHTCEGCGAAVENLSRFSLPWRDERGTVHLDNSATACVDCYAATMEALPLGRMLRVGYRRRG